jgi:hypothetical protein
MSDRPASPTYIPQSVIAQPEIPTTPTNPTATAP